ncbi:hypothetical protein M433DRAFT_333876 [Acidomyces richmondensis BFW]|nr:MAG: hypothetical protein FE78DRAFT_473679 [Acidomyces sp. 'richmondensis']KYG43796.1 hypothetical protein M433DRAFT_333876 [Acidomyces richmondensis BFW]
MAAFSTTIGLGQPTIVTISIIGPGSTAASYGSTGAISSSPPTPAPSIASPSPESDRSHHEGTLSHGALIATIVAPIAFFLILSLGGMLFCFRRRRGLGKSHRLSNTTSTPEMFARLRLPSFAPTNPSLQVPVQFFDPRNESPFADPPTPTSAEVPVYLEPETPLIPPADGEG